MNERFQLVICTCPTIEQATTLARHLVEQQLAGCVNIVPNITSIYQWQGQIESSNEYLLLIKTHQTLYPQLEAFISSLHPYEVPEIIAFSIEQGLPSYLAWLKTTLEKVEP